MKGWKGRWLSGCAVVLAGGLVGCAGTPPPPAPVPEPESRLIRSTWDRCDPGAVELMADMFSVKPGEDAVAVWRTAAHPTEGVVATEGDVEMVLQEAMGGLPEGTELAGRGVFGKLPAGAGPERMGLWFRKELPEDKQRLFVRIIALRVPESGMSWPTCMMVTMDGIWGASVEKHESGALVMKEMARVKAVTVFDESKPPPK
ncbi:hypothetical protein [Myxococcus sp. RHSTA-1-4]|uniref:hypothetical protein n=1 Tax=Myxococcus sp. RHSTA-1-4 TaxID=2874601 RepID=UPI001CC09A50|nr:hypothetical protein [Myxococcus sp. RHSTA-1-4]MBZ4418657.1 hypothetical protein [Myxococcus sp. RHSTA-1-4]